MWAIFILFAVYKIWNGVTPNFELPQWAFDLAASVFDVCFIAVGVFAVTKKENPPEEEEKGVG